MLFLYPEARLLCAGLLLLAAILSASLTTISLVYAAILSATVATRITMRHLHFVLVVGVPLLAALMFVWGLATSTSQVPSPHQSGIEYAIYSWIRILACGGALQCLFLPLIDSPMHLRNFLERNALAGDLGTIVIAAIAFIPEIRRRATRIVEARRAQGRSLAGWRGIRDLPTLLMPLVSSILDSAMRRAEIWTHRGVFSRRTSGDFEYSYAKTAAALCCVAASCTLAYLA